MRSMKCLERFRSDDPRSCQYSCYLRKPTDAIQQRSAEHLLHEFASLLSGSNCLSIQRHAVTSRSSQSPIACTFTEPHCLHVHALPFSNSSEKCRVHRSVTSGTHPARSHLALQQLDRRSPGNPKANLKHRLKLSAFIPATIKCLQTNETRQQSQVTPNSKDFPWTAHRQHARHLVRWHIRDIAVAPVPS